MNKLIDKLKDSSNLIPKIGRKGKANWIFFDKPKNKDDRTRIK